MKPKRIQRKRTKGWKMPENTVYVGRPSTYGNPFVVGVDVETYEEAVRRYELFLKDWKSTVTPKAYQIFISRLADKDLACWCPLDKPCHADVLLRLANQDGTK